MGISDDFKTFLDNIKIEMPRLLPCDTAKSLLLLTRSFATQSKKRLTAFKLAPMAVGRRSRAFPTWT